MVISVHIDFDVQTGQLSLNAPKNLHEAFAVIRMAEAQLQFRMAEAAEAQKALAAQKENNGADIRVVRDLPPELKN